jgi:hypothetical protein
MMSRPPKSFLAQMPGAAPFSRSHVLMSSFAIFGGCKIPSIKSVPLCYLTDLLTACGAGI